VCYAPVSFFVVVIAKLLLLMLLLLLVSLPVHLHLPVAPLPLGGQQFPDVHQQQCKRQRHGILIIIFCLFFN
jgi:hypothetical protein